MAMIYGLDYLGTSSVADWGPGFRNADASSLQATSAHGEGGGRVDGGLAGTSPVEGVQVTPMGDRPQDEGLCWPTAGTVFVEVNTKASRLVILPGQNSDTKS